MLDMSFIAEFAELPPADLVGGKGAALARLADAGFATAAGFCVTYMAFDRLDEARAPIRDAWSRLAGGAVAVRSSVIGEDGRGSSFAGIHRTQLNVRSHEALDQALSSIRASAISANAAAYRRRRGITGPARCAAVVQALVNADVAGVLFTRNPMTGEASTVIEASWGLGESIVSGLVNPDRFVWSRSHGLETRIASKDVEIRPASRGTETVDVPLDRRNTACLDEKQVRALVELGARCEELFGGPQDVEWAFADGLLYVLQSRPITSASSP